MAISKIKTNSISDDAVTAAKIADGTIVAADLAADSVDSSELVAGSVDTAHIAADNIVGSLIADNAIDSEHYTDGSIDTAHIANNAITAVKIDSAVELGGPSLGSSSIIRTNAQTISENITVPATGTTGNAMTIGPVSIGSNYTVSIAGIWNII